MCNLIESILVVSFIIFLLSGSFFLIVAGINFTRYSEDYKEESEEDKDGSNVGNKS